MKCCAILLALALTPGLWGCAKTAAPPPPLSPTPTIAAPEPTLSPKAVEAAFRAALLEELPALPAMQIDGYADLAEQSDLFREFLRALPDAAGRALERAAPGRDGRVAVNATGWKYIAALYHRFGKDAGGVIAQCCALALNEPEPALTIGGPERLYGSCPNPDVFGVTLAYAYLNTVYDDDGLEIPYEHPALDEAYLKNLCDPLPGRRIKDGWYNDRDKGERKHTGTDIRAPEDTEIFSCTNGEVLHIDANDSAGYYVVVRDTSGFEYHYYHMVRLTDFLRVGDYVMRGNVIGHVGNTGNSDANHLHLSVVSPEYTFINPYPMLRDMRALQK